MASEATVFSSDGNWKAEIEAWSNNFFFYKSIGTQVTVYRKTGSSVWGGASWSRANARSFTIQALYNGGLARQDGRWENQSHGELKHYAFGASISVPASAPGGAILIVTSVEGIVSGFFGNGQPFGARVNASDPIADSSIW
jgi:hypothetical protein